MASEDISDLTNSISNLSLNKEITKSENRDNETDNISNQALSGDFQCVCGKIHAQILLGMQWRAKSVFLFLKFYNFVKGIMRIHNIFKKLSYFTDIF